MRSFNPRAPAGRDSQYFMSTSWYWMFQSTRPCGARPNRRNPHKLHNQFQSTRPCGARQRLSRITPPRWEVSIHAPLRGATPPNCPITVGKGRFNPRAPAGRDGRNNDLPRMRSGFQSTRPCGARRLRSIGRCLNFAFQSTRPCGARRLNTAYYLAKTKFQSTRPCGARQNGVDHQVTLTPVSIHAPLRGATHRRLSCGRFALRFNPRAPAGRDYARHRRPGREPCFNPRAPAGRDTVSGRRQRQLSGFNPRAPAGRDLAHQLALRYSLRFNPRAPAGRD